MDQLACLIFEGWKIENKDNFTFALSSKNEWNLNLRMKYVELKHKIRFAVLCEKLRWKEEAFQAASIRARDWWLCVKSSM